VALKNGFIDQMQLISAFDKCRIADGGSLVETLLEHGSLEREKRDALASLVNLEILKQGGSLTAPGSASGTVTGSASYSSGAGKERDSRYRLVRLHAQ
jgi:hypothetical protein